MLLEILDAEVAGHLDTVEAWLARARGGDAHVDDALLRAMHTLNGAFAMTEVPSVTALTSPAEGYIKRMLASHAVADADGVAVIAAVAAAVRSTTAALQQPGQHVPVYRSLARQVSALRDALPEPAIPFGRPGAEELEAERLEAERLEAERLEAERLEACLLYTSPSPRD